MKQFLHVGCGQKDKRNTTKGFNSEEWHETRLDIDESVKPDIVGSITDLATIPSGTFDALFSSHNIEHLYPHLVPIALKEFRRVLKHDGFLVITCPDLLSTAELIVQDKLTEEVYKSNAGPITPLDILYGHINSLKKGKYYIAHKTGFTEKTMRQELGGAGFRRFATCSRARYLDIWALATKHEIGDNDLRELFIEYTGT